MSGRGGFLRQTTLLIVFVFVTQRTDGRGGGSTFYFCSTEARTGSFANQSFVFVAIVVRVSLVRAQACAH